MEGLSSASSDPDRIAMSNGPCCVFGRRPPQPNDCRSMRMSRRQIDHFPPGSYSRRFNLSEIRFRNICRQSPNRILAIAGMARNCNLLAVNLITLCGIVTTSFDAPVDVTGAVNGWTRSHVGRSHRSEIAGDFGGSSVSDRPSIVPTNLTHDTPT